MYTYFECKARYDKVMENGKEKKVTDTYLVDAMSFTEAEARFIEFIAPYISGEFSVSDIKRANYNEYFFCEDEKADKYYSCKLEFISIDEKYGTEKKTRANMLVQAADLRDAMNRLTECMKNTMADYNAVSIKETVILDVIKYEE